MKYCPLLHKLSNGITVILDPMDLETVSIKVRFETGARDETPHEYGITHFCEHMLCSGTSSFPSRKSITDYIEWYGGMQNASTSSSHIALFGRVLAENATVLIKLFAELLQNSLFDERAIEIERRVICDELRRSSDKNSVKFSDFIHRKLFDNAISSLRILGNVENIMSFTRDQMLEFLSRRLSAKNCIICVSGKINDTDEVIKCIESSFSFLPTHDVPQSTEIQYIPNVAHLASEGKNNVKLRIVFPNIWPVTYENRYNRYCVSRYKRFCVERISNVLRQENGLVYGFSGCSYGTNETSVFGYATETSVENLEKVVELISRTAYDIYTNLDISAKDLERYQRKDKLADADWLESATRRCDTLIAEYVFYNRLYDFYEAVDLYGKITPEDVFKMSRGFYSGPMSIVTCGKDFDADLKNIWCENFK